MGVKAFVDQLNQWGNCQKPFFFLIDFEKEKPMALPLDQTAAHDIYLQMGDFQNYSPKSPAAPSRITQKKVIPYEHYKGAFNQVQFHLKKGDTYLLNLTFPSQIDLEGNLLDVFHSAQSSHKLYFKGEFVCFSPERFIQIENNQIATFPMKGTADADTPAAAQKILENTKELWEHSTTVDLLRNDLSIHANHIEVEQFRYLDTIHTPDKKLLQVSSKITGQLDSDWQNRLGDLLWKLLPAGSICGAPKTKTCEIIAAAENNKRGYYTGVYGIFDGKHVYSAVAIRYIEQQNDLFYYRSGGGITAQSNCSEEYEELIQKIYVPAI